MFSLSTVVFLNPDTMTHNCISVEFEHYIFMLISVYAMCIYINFIDIFTANHEITFAFIALRL